jgi:uncharacterized membrane protein YhhN
MSAALEAPASGAAGFDRLSAALLVVLGVSAAFAIASAPWALDRPVLNFVFKPLATLALIALAWRRGDDSTLPEARALRVGLVFSLAGDVALLWPRAGFVWGLSAFLLAHLCYLYAFTRRFRLAHWWPAFAATFTVAALMLVYLWSGIASGLRAPVLAYVACLAAMAAQAAVLWRRGVPRAGWFAIGGALFMLSDALLASNKFAAPLPLASLWILGTYWVAQACLVWGLPPGRGA